MLLVFSNIHKICIFLLYILLTACFTNTSSTSTDAKSELDIAVEEIIDHTVSPALDNFYQKTEELEALSNTFCSSNTKSVDDLTTLQNQWITTNNAWFHLVPYLLGPLTTKDFLNVEAYYYIDSYRSRGQNKSGAIRADINSLIGSSSNISNSDFSNKNFDTVGLLALEIVLFENSVTQSTLNPDILSEYQNTEKKCDILIGQSYELKRRMAAIHQAWHENYRETGKGYRDLLVNKLLEDTFIKDNDIDGTGTPIFTRLVLSTQSYLDFLHKRNITTDVAQLSNSVWLALSSTHMSINDFLAGNNSSTTPLYTLMSNGYVDDVNTMKENMVSLKQAINETETINFKNFAAALDGNFKRELPESLNAALGLNFSDGD